MQVTPDPSLKDMLVDALTEKYSGKREGVHVSDLVYCLREAYYRKTDPQPHTETELMFFVDGSRRHIAIQELHGKASEVKVQWGGVKGTIDILEDCPVEIKTTRARAALPEHYFRQLGYYCAMLNMQRGTLLIQRINNLENPWESYRVEWTRRELERLRREIREKRELLERALQTGDPKILPKSDLPTYNGEPWKCRYCRYREKCESE